MSRQRGVIRILTDRGTEYCGKLESHDYQLYLGVNGIKHTRTKARHPQTNGICERFHKTILHEFYQERQNDLDIWLEHYNTERTHQGKMCCGRTPMQTLLEGKKLWNEKVDSLTNRTRKSVKAETAVRSSRNYYTDGVLRSSATIRPAKSALMRLPGRQCIKRIREQTERSRTTPGVITSSPCFG